MNVLVFNVGSTTLKYACIEQASGQRLCEGVIDRIGQPGGDAPDHVTAARLTLDTLGQPDALPFDAIAHRIVQGGDRFQHPTLVNTDVIAKLKQLDSLAPLHNPPARSVVESMFASHESIPQTLVFDTAYYASLAPVAYRYAITQKLANEHGIRRYGFHGTSHQYVTQQALKFLAERAGEFPDLQPESAKIISLHLGGGASVTASVGGEAIDTSMGMTPLEGLIMATRSGDLDPAIPLYLIRELGMSVDQVDNLLNKQSGLLGLCGEVDMRMILSRAADNEPAAQFAIDMYVRRIIKTIGGYHAILGGLDALIFTAGIGQHSPEIRQRISAPLRHLGIRIDASINQSAQGEIAELSVPDATVRTLVVATDEELAIARQVGC